MVKPVYVHESLSRRLGLLIRTRLWLQVLIAIGLGTALGALLGPDLGLIGRRTADLLGSWLALPGQLFLGLIGMVIIPLAASSIVLGIAGTGGGAALKSVGMRLGVFVVARRWRRRRSASCSPSWCAPAAASAGRRWRCRRPDRCRRRRQPISQRRWRK